MIARFLQSVGVGGDFLQHVEHVRLAVQHPAALWVGLGLLVPLAIHIYRRQQRLAAASPWLVPALTVTRVTVLLLLVLALSGPFLKLEYQREKRSVVTVLFDQSASMELPAGPFENDAEVLAIAKATGYSVPDSGVDAETRKALNRVSRAQLARRTAEAHAETLLKPLGEKFDTRCVGFASEMQPLAADLAQGKLPEPKPAEGGGTLLGDVLEKVLDEAGGGKMSAIVVFSDGQITGGEPLSAAAQRAAKFGVPIFAVPVGAAKPWPDVSVVDVSAAGELAVGDTARVTATLESRGLDGKPVKVQLRQGEMLLDEKEVTLQSREQQHIELTFVAKRPGAQYLTVQVPELPDEPEFLRVNNTDTTLVRVSRERLRVLYVEGVPRWDFRFLKNAMRRDNGLGGRTGNIPDVVLEAEWRRRPTEQAAQGLPRTVEELAQYHVVILGDASPRLVNREFVKALATAVRERSVGLIVEAGPLAMPHAFDEKFQGLLPVRLYGAAAGVQAPAYNPFRVELTPDGMAHEAMRLEDEPERNRNVWALMPPFYWCAAAERAAPGATVLAWNGSVAARQGALPLVAHHFAGAGRVLFVGTDATWRWRLNFGERYFYRFWGQAIRFVARFDATQRQNSLEVRPIRPSPQQPAEIELLAFGADGAPRRENRLPVTVIVGGSVQRVELEADPAQKGRFTGRFTPAVVGR